MNRNRRRKRKRNGDIDGKRNNDLQNGSQYSLAVLSGAFTCLAVSDMLDGFVARKTNTVSRFGAKLDTIADYMFVAICLIKLLPVLSIPSWLYGWIGIIALIKVVNIISGFAVQKKFVAVHSVMNKATGALLFLLPLTIPFLSLKYSAIVVCALATFAAIQEGYLIRTGELAGREGYQI